ncbi:hypothetical protein FJ959_22365 [Mesorhizobium sp. B2-2-4]|uniref:hypothetical protein n=1 Tax=unclassified Mesorhizobium TaxID=325217 RepID=UPI00112C17F4|nr:MULTISPECIES: hypothetical protein [unclassified Mesorhizobium]TPM53275.1 hypothetical protein FJ959_22365 [Mesorhizobium sp. B2-2-4]TPM62081.1 hypothetical protein FJ965_21000 [Mesorhizobium sp. B2-2-1]TPN68452.1 hypothetical protein FJ984_11480 [Mesorhizobium sp. B1-1-3]
MMLAATLGILGLVLALFCVGGFMEGDMAKVGKFGAGFVLCAFLAIMTGAPHSGGGSQNCHIDWDGRANSEVCD